VGSVYKCCEEGPLRVSEKQVKGGGALNRSNRYRTIEEEQRLRGTPPAMSPETPVVRLIGKV